MQITGASWKVCVPNLAVVPMVCHPCLRLNEGRQSVSLHVYYFQFTLSLSVITGRKCYRVTSHLLDFREAILSPCSHFSTLAIPSPVIALASTTVMFCDTSFFSCANCSIRSASFLIWRYDASILDSTRRTWRDRMFCSILITTMDLLALLWQLVLISSPGHALLALMVTDTRQHKKTG